MEDGQYQLMMGDTGVMISIPIPYILMTSLRGSEVHPGDRIVMTGVATGWDSVAQVWQLDGVPVR